MNKPICPNCYSENITFELIPRKAAYGIQCHNCGEMRNEVSQLEIDIAKVNQKQGKMSPYEF
jgi:uncharacterized Zn finger protein